MKKLLHFESPKKQAGAVLLLVLALAFLCELFVCNFKFWHSLGETPSQVTPTLVSGATDLGDGRYRIYKSDAYVEYENINQEVKYVRISPETGYDTKVKFHTTDEGNEYPISAPSRTVNTIVRPTQYIRMHFSGEIGYFKIDFLNTVGTIINTNDIEFNARVPMMFSVVRMLAMVLLVMLLYILRPTSLIYGVKTDLKRRKQKIALAVVIFLQIGTFIGLSFVNTDALRWDDTEVHHRQYYNLIEAFKRGELSTGEGSESLNAMKNPYDFNARVENEVEFNWDNAYYKGKYYSYFGVLPAILLHLPYNLITGGELPNNIAVIVFGIMLIIGAAFLLWEVIKRWYKNTPFVLYIMMSVVFSAISALFYAVYKPDFYMIPPLSALAFSVIALGLWIGAEREDGTLRVSRVMWGALLIALTSMCRPQFLLTLFFGVVLFWDAVFKKRTLFSRTSIRTTLALCLPIIIVAAVAMWYNYARFGSPFDFGANYNLTTNDMTKRGMVAGRTWLGLFTYLFQPIRLDAQFPFVNDFDPATVYQGITITEKQIGGAFAIFPILIFAIAGVFKRVWTKDKLAYKIICFSTVAAVVIVALDTQMAGVLMRYFADFVWLLMLAASMTVFGLYERVEKGESAISSKMLRVWLVVLVYVSMAVAFLSIFAHSKNAVWWSNSIAYQYIKTLVAFWL